MECRRLQNIAFDLIKRGIARKPVNSSTEIRLTRHCTQRCRQCSVYDRRTRPPTMTWENFRTVARRLRDYGAHIGFISGGEATLVPYLDKILIESKKTFRLATTLVTGLVNQKAAIHKFTGIALENDIHIQTSLDGLGALGDDLRGVSHFADTVLGNMEWIADHRGNSKSLLYANIVLNHANLEQVPELIRRIKDLGWEVTIGLYHTLTETTRSDDELRLRPGPRLNTVLDFLEDNPDIMNLNAYIAGIRDFIAGNSRRLCAFVDAPVLATRTTIMENGDVHLCWGEPIGNVLEQSLEDIYTGEAYRSRIEAYKACRGCWTTCYTQRILLIRPGSAKQLLHNLKKVRKLRRAD